VRVKSNAFGKLKEVCEKLAEDGLDELEELFWVELVQAITPSDPAWAISRIAEFIPAKVEEAPQQKVLQEIRKGGSSSAWTRKDHKGAGEWLTGLPPGPARDAAIAGFSETIRRFEPEAAAAWADAISDPEKRIQELSKSVQTWAQTKPDAALNWIVTSELEPALQEQLAREIGFE